MKATALAGRILIEAENDSDVATINLVTQNHRLRLLNCGLGRDISGKRTASMLLSGEHPYDVVPCNYCGREGRIGKCQSCGAPIG